MVGLDAVDALRILILGHRECEAICSCTRMTMDRERQDVFFLWRFQIHFLFSIETFQPEVPDKTSWFMELESLESRWKVSSFRPLTCRQWLDDQYVGWWDDDPKWRNDVIKNGLVLIHAKIRRWFSRQKPIETRIFSCHLWLPKGRGAIIWAYESRVDVNTEAIFLVIWKI